MRTPRHDRNWKAVNTISFSFFVFYKRDIYSLVYGEQLHEGGTRERNTGEPADIWLIIATEDSDIAIASVSSQETMEGGGVKSKSDLIKELDKKPVLDEELYQEDAENIEGMGNGVAQPKAALLPTCTIKSLNLHSDTSLGIVLFSTVA